MFTTFFRGLDAQNAGAFVIRFFFHLEVQRNMINRFFHYLAAGVLIYAYIYIHNTEMHTCMHLDLTHVHIPLSSHPHSYAHILCS